MIIKFIHIAIYICAYLYRLNKEGKPNSRRALNKDTTPEEDADAEGLTQLVPEIQRTVEIVTKATSKLIAESRGES